MVRDLVYALGGPAEVARAVSALGPYEIDSDAVTAWGRRRIPWQWRAIVRQVAAKKGVKLTREWEDEVALTGRAIRRRN